jgi:hypothetical protein
MHSEINIPSLISVNAQLSSIQAIEILIHVTKISSYHFYTVTHKQICSASMVTHHLVDLIILPLAGANRI